MFANDVFFKWTKKLKRNSVVSNNATALANTKK